MLASFVAVLALASQPEPALSELGIEVEAGGLTELSTKVRSRTDSKCILDRPAVTLCVVGAGGEVYQFTEPGHPAHPSGYFLGYAKRDGTVQLEERGWTATDEDHQAEKFFEEAQQAEIKPEALRP